MGVGRMHTKQRSPCRNPAFGALKSGGKRVKGRGDGYKKRLAKAAAALSTCFTW